jgi:hypothetical protein
MIPFPAFPVSIQFIPPFNDFPEILLCPCAFLDTPEGKRTGFTVEHIPVSFGY